jgi:hypothetical protein
MWKIAKQCSSYHCLLKLLHEKFPEEAYQYVESLPVNPLIYQKYFESSIPYKKLFFAKKAVQLNDAKEIKDYIQKLEKQIQEHDVKNKMEVSTFLGGVDYFPTSYLPFYMIPHGRSLFKGTKDACRNFSSDQILSWFGDKRTAQLYARLYGSPHVCPYQTIKSLRMMQPTLVTILTSSFLVIRILSSMIENWQTLFLVANK